MGFLFTVWVLVLVGSLNCLYPVRLLCPESPKGMWVRKKLCGEEVENLGFVYRPHSLAGWLVAPINCGRSRFWAMQSIASCCLIQILTQ